METKRTADETQKVRSQNFVTCIRHTVIGNSRVRNSIRTGAHFAQIPHGQRILMRLLVLTVSLPVLSENSNAVQWNGIPVLGSHPQGTIADKMLFARVRSRDDYVMNSLPLLLIRIAGWINRLWVSENPIVLGKR